MNAAIVTAAGRSPIFGSFREPVAQEGAEVISVSASALSQFSKSRSTGAHYSSDGLFPAVAGIDGTGLTADGRRVYFVMPEAPFGALAERSIVRAGQCIPIPDGLDEVTAAAIANPGMSAWASLVERAHLQPGETVLINGATGTAGRIAVQVAKHLGAGKVIVSGRNAIELEKLNADAVIPFSLDGSDPEGAQHYEKALCAVFEHGIDVVIDYLWGQSARTILAAITQAVEDATPVRFIQVGAASGTSSIDLPSAALRSSSVVLMGSGIKSVPFSKLLEAVKHTFALAAAGKLQIATKTMPLSAIEEAWQAPISPRIVITIP
ncbi:zinc-binding alcohol dehydrogenase family protein [Silvibacterium sp.]|uniref:zinc-binding alcohol dehydrogenase family protein n=1 Tax=Silvibacterium sp. TaxID=1964179 RepID=UPI0039E2466F